MTNLSSTNEERCEESPMAYCQTDPRPGSEADTVPRMSFTEEPSHVWEVGAPAPLEIPEPGHEPAVPELEPAGR